MADRERILLVRLGAIGDALRVLPALRRLRHDRPDAEIGWAVENWVFPVLEGNPDVDRFHILDRRILRRGAVAAAGEFRRFSAELRARRYGVAVDLQGRLKSGFAMISSGAPRRLGYARGDGTEGSFLFANERVHLPDVRENRVQRFLHLLEPLGVEPTLVPGELGVHVDPAMRSWATAWYEAEGCPPLAVYPGSSVKRAPYQRWQVERWAELLSRLARSGYRSTVFWGPTEEDYVRQIMSQSILRNVDPAAEGCRMAPATTLTEMMAMLGCFRVFVGSNTAAMHMSWLQGVATAFFPGPAEPRTDAPFSDVPTRVLWAGEHFREGLPRRQQVGCVTGVTVEQAEEAVRSLLTERSRDRGG